MELRSVCPSSMAQLENMVAGPVAAKENMMEYPCPIFFALGFLSLEGHSHMAVGQNQWYHFGVGAPPILVYFSGDWDVRWGYGILTHGHTSFSSKTNQSWPHPFHASCLPAGLVKIARRDLVWLKTQQDEKIPCCYVRAQRLLPRS